MLRRCGLDNFLTFDLGINERHQVLAVAVLIFFRLESSFQGLDQGHSQFQFFFFYQAGIGVEFLHLADFVAIIHGVHQDAALARTKDHDVLAVVHRNLSNTDAARLPQSLKQQGVGLDSGIFRRKVIGAFKKHGINL